MACCLLGAGTGNKLVSILQFPELWGLARHPTQLYEWLAAGVALVLLPKWKRFFAYEQGLAFRVLMLGYLLWWLLIDGLKPEPAGWRLGLSGIQWVCILGLIVIAATYRKQGNV
ncbi:prolipoprotein diacylglyceryl transferase [Kingella negevensis]|uniref:prolipoprotein diacylglyceryl transferase family protein n=1 Tax=Kingella negevensis TaxID=1522312 RepID=UPI00254331DE|nr:prolipoprotein diacylglyceryl transferase family protein [Kingella negevensis]WII94169.1 prolipoprotein diacylglyceryl transferase [Kingella negevensis]